MSTTRKPRAKRRFLSRYVVMVWPKLDGSGYQTFAFWSKAQRDGFMDDLRGLTPPPEDVRFTPKRVKVDSRHVI